MATYSNFAPIRDDFRCSLCRQKSAFHCEHDTPYRDRILGTYDQEKAHMSSSNSRRESRRTNSHANNNSSNYDRRQDAHTGQNANSNIGSRNQHDKRAETNAALQTNPNAYPNGSKQLNEPKKKNKSCVIL